MKTTKPFLHALALAVFLFGCSNDSKKEQIAYQNSVPNASVEEKAAESATQREVTTHWSNSGTTDLSGIELNATAGQPSSGSAYTYGFTQASPPAHVLSSSAATGDKNDTTRKFIRTADLKFRVKEVVKATYELEDIAARFDGFVTYTNLFSTITNTTLIPISPDSSLETLYYVVQNTMTIRVFNEKLDSTLKAIAPVVDFLDHRIVKADDVQFQLLENTLRRERNAKYQDRMEKAVDERGKKLAETSNAEDKMLSRQEQSDAARIENLKLADKIEFSTISLYIYQRESFRREVVPNDKNIEAYGPGFFTKVGNALMKGWRILEGIIIFLAKSWGVVLVIAVLLVIGRFVFFRRNPS